MQNKNELGEPLLDSLSGWPWGPFQFSIRDLLASPLEDSLWHLVGNPIQYNRRRLRGTPLINRTKETIDEKLGKE